MVLEIKTNLFVENSPVGQNAVVGFNKKSGNNFYLCTSMKVGRQTADKKKEVKSNTSLSWYSLLSHGCVNRMISSDLETISAQVSFSFMLDSYILA